ncbi:subtilisin-like protein [Ramicandelaber brevisporus]|nr:subtilisin-like protein [Ramicandelaber brevisporus]
MFISQWSPRRLSLAAIYILSTAAFLNIEQVSSLPAQPATDFINTSQPQPQQQPQQQQHIPRINVRSKDAVPNRYIVRFVESDELTESATAAGTASSSQSTSLARMVKMPHSLDSISSFLSGLGMRFESLVSFVETLPAIAVSLADPRDVARLAAEPGIHSVTPVERMKLTLPSSPSPSPSPPASSSPSSSSPSSSPPIAEPLHATQQDDLGGQAAEIARQMASVHNITGLLEARRKFNLTGRGVKVGVVDSGIDIHHPAFGSCTSIGQPAHTCRVVSGYDFVDNNAEPFDKCGFAHGTHTAGIIGSQDPLVIGVAPGVTFGAYRSLDCNGFASSETVLKGLEQAVADGCHVINVSIGGDTSFPDDIVSAAIERIAARGITVVVSTGNAGDLGLWSAVTPSTSHGALAVGSIDGHVYPALVFTSNAFPGELLERSKQLGSGDLSHSQLPQQPQQPQQQHRRSFDALSNVALIAVEATGSGASCGTSVPLSSVAGKAVLLRFDSGDCPFQALQSLLQSQPAAILVYWTSPLSAEFGTGDSAIPVVTVPSSVGTRLHTALQRSQQQPVTVSGVNGPRVVPNPYSGQVSYYSSRGPAPDLHFKPQIMAPGGYIFSTVPVQNGTYRVLSGSSMSAPYIAGVAALLIEQRGKLTPVQIREAIQATARSEIPHTNNTFTNLQNPAVMGAGVVNVNALLSSVVTLTPTQLSLNDTNPARFNGAHTRTLQFSNPSDQPLTFALSHHPSAAATRYDANQRTKHAIAYTDSPATVTLSPDRITIPARSTRSVQVSIVPPRLPQQYYYIYGGVIRATPVSSSSASDAIASSHPILQSVYMGMAADIMTMPLIVFDNPASSWSNLTTFAAIPESANPVVDPGTNNVASFASRIDYSTRLATAYYESSSGTLYKYLEYLEHVAAMPPVESAQDPLMAFGATTGDFVCPAATINPANRCEASKGSKIPNGVYRLVLAAQRPFGNPANESGFHIVKSPWYTLRSTRT